MKKLLITGVSGFLGWNICRVASQKYNVTGICNRHTVVIPGINVISCNLTDHEKTSEIFDTIKPDLVIHAAAASNPNYCQLHPVETDAINVTVSGHIASLCAALHIPCAFTSTDLVFNGKSPPYKEDDQTCPINIYGEQKARAEQLMMSLHHQIAICRMPLMYGDAPPAAASFIQSIIQQLQNGKKVSLFTDEFRTPVSATDAASGLLIAVENLQGIIHLGGKERISRFEMGKKVAKITGLKEDLIMPCSQKDVPMAAPRPGDVSLDSTLAYSSGYMPKSINEELEKLACVRK